MTTLQIITLMIFHGIFDWVLQDRKTAENKSKNIKYLAGHLVILLVGLLVWAKVFSGLDSTRAFLWAISNVVLHGFIDWNLWKIYVGIRLSEIMKYVNIQDYPYYKDKLWFDFIMIDQLLHGLCYIGVYHLLK